MCVCLCVRTEDSYRKNAMIDNELALLDILDTAGQEEFSSMQDEWIRVGDGFLLVYSITTRNTFDEVHRLREKILRAHNVDHMPMYACSLRSALCSSLPLSLSSPLLSSSAAGLVIGQSD